MSNRPADCVRDAYRHSTILHAGRIALSGSTCSPRPRRYPTDRLRSGIMVEEAVAKTKLPTSTHQLDDAYAAPELHEDARVLAPEVDVYSLGAVGFGLEWPVPQRDWPGRIGR